MLNSLIQLRLHLAAHGNLRRLRRGALRIEELESRTLLSAYAPAQIRAVYGFNQLSYTGSGVTIAIVDAYDDPNIASDLAAFDSRFNIPAPPSFTKATPQGQPSANAGWAQEIALDVEWAHAIAPGARILLVEARDSSFTNLLAAVDYAANNAQVVSLSWGGAEFSGETGYDWHFSRSGVTFVAASGDNGGSPEWPATSTHVLAVGGTSLGSSGETGWSASGGGVSRYEPKPSFQSTESLTRHFRGSPDVAYDASPSTGVSIYDSYGSGGWAALGGTSVGTPQWAALIALADQGRGRPLSGDTQVLPALYQIYGSSSYTSYFNDIQSGSNGFAAGVGYDFVTGLGSPRANNLVPYLVGYSGIAAALSKNPSSRVVANSATAVPNAQLVTVLAAPTPAQPRSSSGVATSSPTAGTQASLVPTLPGSAAFLAASSHSVLSRIESGGGDNAALQDDEEPEQGPASPMGNGKAAPKAMPPAPVDPAVEGQPMAGRRQASDACFADPCGTTNNLIEAGRPGSPIITDLPLDRTAGGVLLAALVGCYWRAQFKDVERRAHPELLN